MPSPSPSPSLLPAQRPGRAVGIARLVATLLVCLLAARAAHQTWVEASALPAERAADALPVYLAAAAVLDGEDPTTQEGLQRAYDRRGLTVRAATFSNLYPATAGVLMTPLARGTWEEFVGAWRLLLLLGGLVAGALGGLAAARGPNAPLAAAIGAWLAVGAFPVTGECIALGQANLLVGGTLGVAMAALRWSRGGLAGAVAVLGGALKLVPGVVAWSLLAGRRWRALGWTAAVGLGVLGVTLTQVPLDRVVDGVLGTLRFQGAISPGWIVDERTPGWVRLLGDLRHTPLMAVTLVAMGATAWAASGAASADRRGATLAGTVALATAWLGADAAGFHVLYAPLYIPALAWVACWPLDPRAPRWALAAAAAAALPAALLAWGPTGAGDEARLVLAGLAVWALCGVRLVATAPPLSQPAWGGVGAAAGWGVAAALSLSDGPRGPDPALVPDGDVSGLGLPDGVGHGGPQPGDRPPGATSAGGGSAEAAGPDGVAPSSALDPNALATPAAPRLAGTGTSGVTLQELLEPDQASRLTSHLVQAPKRWGQLDHPLAAWLARDAPRPPAALVRYGPLARWMAWETVGFNQVEGSDSVADEYRRTWARISRTPPP